MICLMKSKQQKVWPAILHFLVLIIVFVKGALSTTDFLKPYFHTQSGTKIPLCELQNFAVLLLNLQEVGQEKQPASLRLGRNDWG